MKKILFLVVLGLAIGRTSSAQNAINSVPFYDVKNAAAEQTYIATLKEINAIMVEIGYPKNYYSHLKLAASDTTKTYRNCTIGHWTSEKDYKTIQSAWRSIRSAGERKETDKPSPASDMALIFGFMKLLDPNSTVREGEYATAQNATGIPGRVANAYNKAIDGVILNIDQRNDFLGQSKKQYDARLGEYKELKTTYTKLAKRKGFDPENVVLEFNIPEEAVSDKENLVNAATTIAKQLVTLPKGSPEETKARQDLIVIREKIVEAQKAEK